MTCQIVVSIINYRTAELTLNCVRSALDDMNGIDGQIVVVDNASEDGSAETIATWIEEQPDGTPVRLIRSSRNTGFSGGHNQGMAAIEAEYYLILNSDAVLRPGFLNAILSTAEAQPEAGLIAPRIETEGGETQVSCFRFHSPWSELIRAAGSGPVTRLLHRHVVALPPPVTPSQVQWVSFCCVLLRGRMVRALGPMDEGYFLYFEDCDYALQAARSGWSIALSPNAAAIHFRGGSGPVKSLERNRKRLPGYFYASRNRFLWKAHGRIGVILANFFWVLGRSIAQTRHLAGKPVPQPIEAEWRDIWTNALRPDQPGRGPED